MKRKHTDESDVAVAPAAVVDPHHFDRYEDDGAGDVGPHKPSYDGIEGDG